MTSGSVPVRIWRRSTLAMQCIGGDRGGAQVSDLVERRLNRVISSGVDQHDAVRGGPR